jgi:hypothetical protein
MEVAGMLILGIILLVLGFVLDIQVLWIIGIVLLVIGAVLWFLGALGRPVAGRRYWF